MGAYRFCLLIEGWGQEEYPVGGYKKQKDNL